MLTCYGFALLFTAIAISFYTGHALHYMKAYTSMTEQERNKIKALPLCRHLSIPIFTAAILLFLSGYSDFFRLHLFRWCIIFWFGGCILDLWYIHRSKRYEVIDS